MALVQRNSIDAMHSPATFVNVPSRIAPWRRAARSCALGSCALGSWSRVRLGAALALGLAILAGAASPRSVEAGCGNHIVYRGPTDPAARRLATAESRARPALRFDSLGHDLHGLVQSFIGRLGALGGRPRMPDGPGCDGRDGSRDSFAPPPVPRERERTSVSALASNLGVDVADDSLRAHVAAPRLFAICRADGLWRPPRFSTGY